MENIKNTVTEKRPVSSTMRKMEIGDLEVFPRSQYTSIISTKTRFKIEQEKVFKHELKENCITVTRIA